MSDDDPRSTLSELVYDTAGGALGVAATLLRPLLGRWDLTQRLGHGDRLPGDLRPLWIHAASVGEISTLRPLAAETRSRLDGIHWGLTTTTRTGAQAAAEHLSDAMFRRLLPLDVWPATDRFLDAVHPGAAIFLETELWPRLMLSLARRRVPTCLASARLSESSVRGYRRFGGLFRRVLRSLDLIATRSEDDRTRFLELGADPRRTVVLGNTKLDNAGEPPPFLEPEKDQRVSRMVAGRSLVVWGSLRPGEEAIATTAIRATGGETGAFWVLAPRHPSEFDRTAEFAARAGLRTSRWSACSDSANETVDLLILDTLGELRAFYVRADVAVVGGSFGEYGGHNLMEPAGLGVPVLFGPDTGEWPEDTTRLLESGGGARVQDADELRDALIRLMQEPEERQKMGHAAREAAGAGQGASRRIVDTLLEAGFFDGVTRD
jgi:3-deoxy-D-manno-octulosonic-acid transferase